MSQINVLVVMTSPPSDEKARDIVEVATAEGIAKSVLARRDMNLVGGDPESLWVAEDEVESLLKSIPSADRCALVLVGRFSKGLAE